MAHTLANMQPTDLDELIAHEKKQAAIEYQNEAWADAISEGIEPEIMAEAALSIVLTELVREAGDEHALTLLDRMRDAIIAGHFREQRILQ